MNRRPLFAWLGIATAVIVTFGAGLYVGVILGVDQFQKLDSSAKASVLTTELRALRAGDVEKIIQVKEIELDGKLAPSRFSTRVCLGCSGHMRIRWSMTILSSAWLNIERSMPLSFHSSCLLRRPTMVTTLGNSHARLPALRRF
jgi:hypothetical protein